MQKAKDDWIQFQCKSIEDYMRHGRYNKRAYETLITLTKTIPRSTSIIEDSKSIPLTEDSMILKRWTEYCNDIYNHQIN